MKYLVMICRGHVPLYSGRINKDVEPFLRYFMPPGTTTPGKDQLQAVVRQFHLAFKGMETEEIYDILMAILIATIRKYDPYYIDKVKLVVERMDSELSKRTPITVADVNRYLDFDSDRHLRLLGRHGFLAAVPGKAMGFTRTELWLTASLFHQAGIGIANSLPQWFRFQPILSPDDRI